jgi:hypothetical protein
MVSSTVGYYNLLIQYNMYTVIKRISSTHPNIGYNSIGLEFYISDDLMLEVPFFIIYNGAEIEILRRADVDDNEDLMMLSSIEYASDSFQTKDDIILYEIQEFDKLIREV